MEDNFQLDAISIDMNNSFHDDNENTLTEVHDDINTEAEDRSNDGDRSNDYMNTVTEDILNEDGNEVERIDEDADLSNIFDADVMTQISDIVGSEILSGIDCSPYTSNTECIVMIYF